MGPNTTSRPLTPSERADIYRHFDTAAYEHARKQELLKDVREQVQVLWGVRSFEAARLRAAEQEIVRRTCWASAVFCALPPALAELISLLAAALAHAPAG